MLINNDKIFLIMILFSLAMISGIVINNRTIPGHIEGQGVPINIDALKAGLIANGLTLHPAKYWKSL